MGSAPRVDALLLALFVGPLAVTIGRLPILPTAVVFARFFSLTGVPPHLQHLVASILFVPLGALVSVVFRLTLGIRLLSLFRPILLALAFSLIGIRGGLVVLLGVLSIVAFLRPALRHDHEYARVAVLLSLVAALLLAPLLVGAWWHIPLLYDTVWFPVIALCLTCEGFAKVQDRDGLAVAVWRTAMTVLAALVIEGLADGVGAIRVFVHFPELVLVLGGCILLIGKYLDLRLWDRPPARALRQAALRRLTVLEAPGTRPSDNSTGGIDGPPHFIVDRIVVGDRQ
jgi:hypothetical protein